MTGASSEKPHLEKVTKDFVEKITKETTKPLYELSFETAREVLNQIQSEAPAYTNLETEVSDMEIFTRMQGTMQVRCIRPKNNKERLPLIIYIHGGGWILGNEKTHDTLIKRLSICTNSVVLFPKYTPSPEAQYPKAIEGIYALLDYVCKNDDEFNCDSDKLIIAGDSAGANMATACAIKAKKENGTKILLQVLLYPVTSALMDTKSYELFKDGPWLTQKAMEWFWNTYLPDKSMRQESYASPLCADMSELKDLPPALIITAENDVLRDEGEAYARKLESAGVKVASVRINGTIHDFMMLNALSNSTATDTAFCLTCNTIKNVLKSCQPNI